MNSMDKRHNSQFPIQAQPVYRDRWAPATSQTADGVQAAAAAKSCDSLTGMARQMCYAARYGASV
ncbi:hypothetical protein AB0H73_34515 [Streptomyces olivoreticuli]